MNATALIAEDEPLLAAALQAGLAQAWPGLQILSTVGDGHSAVAQALALKPQILFLDIRMPGQSGLEAATELAEEWPTGVPFAVIVFVTAYDQYALQAFETQAVDYLIKPVQPERLACTVQRLQQRLAAQQPDLLEQHLQQLRALLAPGDLAPSRPGTPALRVIQAGVGNQIRLVPIDEVLVFEAGDKYVRVLTPDSELLIRTPLKDLLSQLDPQLFWQIHRSTVVRAQAILQVQRDELGKLSLLLHGRPERWKVSRLHAGRFKAM
jgi:DNA-binding LytR/AlgR family response regulator